MEEFLIENYTLLTRSAEITAALTGIMVYRKYKSTPTKYFIYFLLYVLFLETIGSYPKFIRPNKFLYFLKDTLIETNFWMFTLGWTVGAIVFFVFYYKKVLINNRFKLIIHYGGLIYLVFSVIYIIINLEKFFHVFFPTLSIFGALIIFTCCIFYFLELLGSERILYFYKSVNFYITFVIFIWWLIITPLVFYDLFYGAFDLSKPFKHPEFFGDINFVNLSKNIYLFSNIFMYLTFTFALIFCKPEHEVKSKH